jgi:(S)-2-hydroxyglutarate dehydrogenase
VSHYVVVGGGIVGLATAYQLTQDYPHSTVTVLEKEDRVAGHQTGHNSGVIHAGVYYKPGSLKAELCRTGAASMVEFCRAQGIPYQICGKLIVATDDSELPRLHALYERAQANGLPVTMIGPEQAREYEPNVACVAAIRVASTGIVDYAQVAQRLAELIEKAGGNVRLGVKVITLRPDEPAVVVGTNIGAFRADYLINCAGLFSDRLARMAGLTPPARIVPFRGEYYELREERRDLVRGLIYPVPDPQFPFLGVHLTRGIDGHVHVGPNAVLALAREGYSWREREWADLRETIRHPGFRKLAAQHWRYGAGEMVRSMSKRRFTRALRRLVPEVTVGDLEPAPSGVRAQAIREDGSLVDDFAFQQVGRALHVLNAPSPAATASLEIGRVIAARLPD